jgi:hypothetical protein
MMETDHRIQVFLFLTRTAYLLGVFGPDSDLDEQRKSKRA